MANSLRCQECECEEMEKEISKVVTLGGLRRYLTCARCGRVHESDGQLRFGQEGEAIYREKGRYLLRQ